MARRTFISYKYSEAQKLRDDIIEALGDDATYYQGETSDSPDLTDASTDSIRKRLTDMMYNTSNNRYRRNGQAYACNNCKSHSMLDGSYISIIDEKVFLDDPDKFIENAYEKSERADEFDLRKKR
ncbi:MAG: hypothetical protein OXH96_04250 [Spirochaetaceae bacterium]|nr:hypothetical protein [Spirochaetaceae bacterium]